MSEAHAQAATIDALRQRDEATRLHEYTRERLVEANAALEAMRVDLRCEQIRSADRGASFAASEERRLWLECTAKAILPARGKFPDGWGVVRATRGTPFTNTGELDLCPSCFTRVHVAIRRARP